MRLQHKKKFDATLLCDHFPKYADCIRHLALSNARFRDTCEDYCLALTTLTDFKQESLVDRSVEITDFQTLVFELRKELEAMLMQSSNPGRDGARSVKTGWHS